MEEKYFENLEAEIGEEFETDRGERFKVVGKQEDGTPICEPLSKITMDFGEALKALKNGRKEQEWAGMAPVAQAGSRSKVRVVQRPAPQGSC